VVESLALSRPEVGFFLRSDGRRSLAFPAAADLRERISQVHGLSLARSLVALEDPVVWGFVSPLAVSFPTRRYLHVAVNGRVVEADSFAPAVAGGEDLAKALACKGSTRFGENLSSEEMETLLKEWSETNFRGHAPQGGRTFALYLRALLRENGTRRVELARA